MEWRNLLCSIARRAKWTMRIRVVCVGCCWISIALAVFIAIDFRFRPVILPIRIAISSCAYLSIFYFVYRLTASIYSFRPTEVAVARWIERNEPHWRSKLSTAIAFEASGESNPLSIAFGNRLMEKVEQEFDTFGFGEIAICRSLRLYAIGCIILLLVTLTLSIASPGHVFAGTCRLLFPWRNHQWPTKNQLVFAELPQRVSVGDDLSVSIVDEKSKLPDDVEIQYFRINHHDQRVRVKKTRRRSNRATASFANVRSSLRLRAVGGDDFSMGWKTVHVAYPPEVKQILFTAIPPNYTGLSETEVVPPTRLLDGTGLRVSGVVKRRLRNAEVIVRTNDRTQTIPLLLHDNKLAFETSPDEIPVIQGSARFTIQVSDFRGEKSSIADFLIEGVPDLPPVIRLNSSANYPFATVDGVFTVQGRITDDLALAKVSVETSTGQVLSGVEQLDPPGNQLKTMECHHDFEFSQLSEVVPGMAVGFTVLATDNLRQISRSGLQQVTILSSEDFQDHLARRKERQLERIRNTNGKLLAIYNQLKVKHVESDRGINVSWIQVDNAIHKACGVIADLPDSVIAELDEIIVQANRNLVKANGFQSRMQELSQTLQSVRIGRLEDARRALPPKKSDSTQEFEMHSMDDPRRVTVALAIKSAVDQLDELLKDHEQYRTEHSVLKQVQEILIRQIELRRDVEKSLTQRMVNSQQVLSSWAATQLQLARSAENSDVNQVAISFLRIPIDMRGAATSLRRGELDSALQKQQEVESKLHGLINDLADRRRNTPQQFYRPANDVGQANSTHAATTELRGLLEIRWDQFEINQETKKHLAGKKDLTTSRNIEVSKSLGVRQTEIAKRLSVWKARPLQKPLPVASENTSKEGKVKAASSDRLEALFEGLSTMNAPGPGRPSPHQIEDLAHRMNEVGERLAGDAFNLKNSTLWVVELQVEILQELDKLMKPSDLFNGFATSKQPVGDEQKTSARNLQNVGESRSKRSIRSNEKSVDLARDEAWGHLPEHIQRQIQRVDSDGIHPKYAEQVQRYYDNLMETQE